MNQRNNPFQYRVAMVGNPVVCDPRFDDAQLRPLADWGFNMVQLNIAWGSRPGDEPLNLEDIATPHRREELDRRAARCKTHGLRTLFHFGTPHVKNLYTELSPTGTLFRTQAVAACIQLPEVVARSVELVQLLGRSCPQIDDMLVYTYDQEAWLCSEFGECPRCRGIPLSQRLPGFLRALRDAWAAVRPQGRLWWEPWELSAGQIYQIVPGLPTENFGLMLHSNIAEVQATRPVDPWFRNTAKMAGERGIPVIGEVFLSSATQEVAPLQRVVAPRLVYQQLAALRSVPHVSGVKEYYGLRPDLLDPNLEMAGRYFQHPQLSLEEHLVAIADRFGPTTGQIRTAWEATTDAMERFPWDISWRWSMFGQQLVHHHWQAFWVPGFVTHSPSWCSTRRSIFMLTEDEPRCHPWLIEDVALRLEAAAEQFAIATAAYETALSNCPASLRPDVQAWQADVRFLGAVTRSYACHAQETLVADLIRQDLEHGRAAEKLLNRLSDLLKQDAANQNGWPASSEERVPAAVMLERFQQSPRDWARHHLLPIKTEGAIHEDP